MSGSYPVLSASIAALLTSSWAGQGGQPYFTLTELAPGFPNPAVSGACIRVFSADMTTFTDRGTDATGFSSMSLDCIDAFQSWFGTNSNIGVNLPGSNYTFIPSNFPSMSFTNDIPQKAIKVGITITSSLNLSITAGTLNYATTATTQSRTGVYISASSGTPPLSMEPSLVEPLQYLPGDVWFRSGTFAGEPNFMFADTDGTTSGSVYVARILAARDGETSQSVITRFGTADRPSSSVLAVNTVITDNWLTTLNSATTLGAGWRNETWGGGMFMPNSGTVSVWSASGSAHNFLIPSGSLTVRNTITIQSGSLVITTGSIQLNSGSIYLTSGSIVLNDPSGSFVLSGSNAQLIISGSGAASLLRGFPIINVMTGSLNSGTLSGIQNGTLYINTSSLPTQISLRVQNSWFDFAVIAPNLVDGGTY
jgi:hypothetical protein